MSDMTLTLKELREEINLTSHASCNSMLRRIWLDAIDRELSARGEAVFYCDPAHAKMAREQGGIYTEATSEPDNVNTMPLFAAPPAPKLTVDDAMIDRALNSKLPSGAKVSVYVSPCVEYSQSDIMRAALAAAVEGGRRE